MLRELLSIFRPGNPLQAMADNFAKMIELTHEQTVKAGEIYFSRTTSPESRSEIRRMDVEVNKLERKIRKQVIQRLSLRGTTQQVPYSLSLLSCASFASSWKLRSGRPRRSFRNRTARAPSS